MPDPTLSQAIKEAYASAPSDVIVYHTLTIDHPNFTQPIYVVRDTVDLVAHLETDVQVTFVRYAFDLVKPEVSATGVPQCTITIDNVSREILANIQLALQSLNKITITYREYLSTDLSGPQNDPPLTMTVLSIKADVFRITATAGFPDLVNKKFPAQEYTSERFPGLVS
jgi:hypothetical protein